MKTSLAEVARRDREVFFLPVQEVARALDIDIQLVIVYA